VPSGAGPRATQREGLCIRQPCARPRLGGTSLPGTSSPGCGSLVTVPGPAWPLCPHRGRSFTGDRPGLCSCRSAVVMEACRECVPGWRSQGWWCFRCQTAVSAHDLRLGMRGLLVVEADQRLGAWHVAWPYIPFATVGQLLQHLASEVIAPVCPWQVLSIEVDGYSCCLTPPTLTMDDVVLWKLRPRASPLLVRARVTQLGDGIPRRLALRRWAVAPRGPPRRNALVCSEESSQEELLTAFSCSSNDTDSEPEWTRQGR